jgi:predicted ATPase
MKIKLLYDTENNIIKKGTIFNFNKDVNIITGDQGSGKTTLLNCISSTFNDPENPDIKVLHIDKSIKKYIHLDTLKDTPDRYHGFNFSMLSQRFSSHGEQILYLIELITSEIDVPTLYLLDEPEAALSISSIVYLLRLIDMFVKNKNCKFIIATHNERIIKHYKEVFNMDKRYRKFMSSDDYIKLCENRGKKKKIIIP